MQAYSEMIWKKITDFNTSLFLSWDFYCAQKLLFSPLKTKAEVCWTDSDGTRHCQATLTWNQQFASWRALTSGTGEQRTLPSPDSHTGLSSIINKVKSLYNLSFSNVGIIFYCNWGNSLISKLSA